MRLASTTAAVMSCLNFLSHYLAVRLQLSATEVQLTFISFSVVSMNRRGSMKPATKRVTGQTSFFSMSPSISSSSVHSSSCFLCYFICFFINFFFLINFLVPAASLTALINSMSCWMFQNPPVFITLRMFFILFSDRNSNEDASVAAAVEFSEISSICLRAAISSSVHLPK